jgi:hypothetical protein
MVPIINAYVNSVGKTEARGDLGDLGIDNVKGEVKQVGCDNVEWLELAQERVQ